VKLTADDLFDTPLEQAEIDFENEGGETYICGNPPYLGGKWQSDSQKSDLAAVFDNRVNGWKSLDYVAAWFMKAADYGMKANATTAFVSTNSICQGLQVPILWPSILLTGHQIAFAHTSFKWANLATHNAGVTVVIVGISKHPDHTRSLFSETSEGVTKKETANINAYLVAGENAEIRQRHIPLSDVSQMLFGNMPRDGGNFGVSYDERQVLIVNYPELTHFIRPYLGSEEMIQGKQRWCYWIEDQEADFAQQHPVLGDVLQKVCNFRLKSRAPSTRDFAQRPHRFVQIAGMAKRYSLAIAKVSSERRPYLPVTLFDERVIISDLLFALYDVPLWNMALIASRLHLVWIATVCGKLKTDFRYSNTLGWNTFPVPLLTEQNKLDLTRCAENILLAREAHFPATIADLYAPDVMPENLRHAHEMNDEILERIYIGRRFRNDTERLEKLFGLYTQLIGQTQDRAVKGKKK
jgi:hypothetical protein